VEDCTCVAELMDQIPSRSKFSGLLSSMLNSIGSRRISICFQIPQFGFSLASSFVDCLSFFTFLRFCSGAAITGLFVGHYVYILELVGTSYRTMAGKVQDVFWVLGACLMIMIAYFVRDWRHVLLIASFPAALFYLLWRWVLQTDEINNDDFCSNVWTSFTKSVFF